MQGTDVNWSEIYFIIAMMILILVVCTVATVAFFKTYYREKADREKQHENAQKIEDQKPEITN